MVNKTFLPPFPAPAKNIQPSEIQQFYKLARLSL